jgi:REP-associated tyrosine transposase
MPRNPRQVEPGTIYHVFNRGNGRRMLFSKEADFAAFVKLLRQALERFEVDLLAYCLMGNHWHLLIRPRTSAALSRCLAWIAVTHARRHHKHYPAPGSGHLYQGRFKSFPVQSDEHFLIVARYIHANPLRAGLAKRLRDWPWNDLSSGVPTVRWPVDRPRNWTQLVERHVEPEQLEQIERSLKRGAPFGSPQWVDRTAKRLGLESTLRAASRPPRPLETLSPRQQRRRKANQSGQKST